MPTPYSRIENVFHSSFQSKVILPPDLEEQFFITAIGDYSLDLRDLTYNSDIKEISEDLSQSEINLLGKLMYKAYLQRERDRVLKLNNILGRDIKLTGMADSKFAMNTAYITITNEISAMIHKLKTNSFSE